MILSPNEIAYAAKPFWADKGLTSLTDGVGGFYSHFEVSVAVSLGESGGDTEALGRSSTGTSIGNRDHGLWQVSNRWHQLKGDGSPGILLLAGPLWRQPDVNAKMAFTIWDDARRAGKDPWSPWSVYTSGSFKTYLPDARIACKAPWAWPTSQLTVIQAMIDGAVGKASDIEGTRLASLQTALSNEIGGSIGDLELTVKAELADTEATLVELIKQPHVLTQTFQIQS